jgi:hypothetical protein
MDVHALDLLRRETHEMVRDHPHSPIPGDQYGSFDDLA